MAEPTQPPASPGTQAADNGGTPVRSRPQRRLQATLVIIAVVAGIIYASTLLIPIVTGVLLAFLFKPLVRWLDEWRIRPSVSATLITLMIIVGIVAGIAAGGGQVTTYVRDIPALLEVLRERFSVVFETARDAGLTAEEEVEGEAKGGVEAIVEQDLAPGEEPLLEEPERPPLEVFGVQPGDVVVGFFSQTGSFLVGLVVALGLMFFLLASGDLFLLKLVQLIPKLSDKKEAVVAAHQLEGDVSAYLVTLTCINAGVAVVTFVPYYLLGMPQAPLWAAAAGLLNYVPYIGPIFYLIILTPAALVSFESMEYALFVPLSFFVVNTLEAYVITPTIMGKRFRINPVIVFVWLTIWGWAWGIAGALLATPLLVCFRIVCEHIDMLQSVAHFLSDSPERTDDDREQRHEETAAKAENAEARPAEQGV